MFASAMGGAASASTASLRAMEPAMPRKAFAASESGAGKAHAGTL